MDQKPAVNPLRAHFRQPAIYLELPSGGQFWESGLDLPSNTGDIPVYPMTARDEILLKTPDALLNGQGVVDVIESCCPNITNAWQTPSVDVDSVLIAIRIASYGSSMAIDTKCPHCETENTFDVDLNGFLDNVQVPDYTKKFEHGNIRIKIKPQNYASINETNKINYEQQRVLENISMDGTEDVSRVTEYKKHIARLVDLNAKLLVDNTEYIELVDTGVIVNQPEFIEEFYFNCDADICKELQARIAEVNREGAIKPQTGNCSNCGESFDIALTFDYASFFDSGS
jgi:hypothetical protein